MPDDAKLHEVLEVDAGPGQFDCDERSWSSVKVAGYGRGRLTVEAVATGGLFASASKNQARMHASGPRVGLPSAGGL